MSDDSVRRERSRLAAYRATLARQGKVASRGAALCRTTAGSSRSADGRSSVHVELFSGGAVHESGVQVCKNAWACPDCAPKIAEVRAREIAAGIRAAQAASMVCFLATLTLSHRSADRLSVVFDAVRRAWRYSMSGKAAQSFRRHWGHVGTIRTLEITAGESGWHPHLHVVLMFEPGVLVDVLRGWLHQRWAAAAAKDGRRVSLGRWLDGRGRVRFVGVDVQEILPGDADEVGRYCSKWGVEDELSAAHAKRGKSGRWSPMQLLAAAADGDPLAELLWCEYEAETAGKHSIHWSQGLRRRLGELPTTDEADALVLGVEVSDEEAAQSVETFGLPPIADCWVEPDHWNRLVRSGRRWEVGAALRAEAFRHEWMTLLQFLETG